MKYCATLIFVSMISLINQAHADCVDSAVQRAKEICGDLEIKRTEFDFKIQAQANAQANAIVRNFIGLDTSGNVSAARKEIVGLVGVELQKDRFEARVCRERIYSKVADLLCSKDVVYKTCARPEFGILRYDHSSSADENSGWRGGGGNQNGWCNELAGRVIGRNQIGPAHDTAVLGSSEGSRRRGLGHVEYNYKCSVRVDYDPVYNSRQDPLCGVVGNP